MRIWDKSRPPSGPFALNRDSAQAVGLVAWYPGNGGGIFVPDYVGATHATSGTAGTFSLNPSGAPMMQFASASSQYVEALSSPVSTYPLSMSAWVTAANWTTAQAFFAICTNGGDARFQLQLGDGATPSVLARAYNSAATSAFAQLSTGVTTGVEAHIAGRFLSATSRFVWTNGVASAQETTNIVTTGTNRIVLGARRASTGIAAFLNGAMRDARVYSRDVGTSEWKAHIDPGQRYELWYPLRSRKWFSAGAGSSLDLTQTANIALTGVASVSGAVQIGVSFDLTQTANVALTGVAGASGDVQIGTSFDLSQTASVVLSGSASVSGDIQILTGVLDLVQTASIALSGAASVSGNVQIGTAFDLAQTANVALTGIAGLAGDVQIGVGLDLAQTAPIALTGTTAVQGDIQTASFTGLFYAQGDLSFAHGETPKKALRRRLKEATAELPPLAELPKPLKFEITYARRVLATSSPKILDEQIAAVERAIEHSRERVAIAAQARKARRRAQQVRLLLED